MLNFQSSGWVCCIVSKKYRYSSFDSFKSRYTHSMNHLRRLQVFFDLNVFSLFNLLCSAPEFEPRPSQKQLGLSSELFLWQHCTRWLANRIPQCSKDFLLKIVSLGFLFDRWTHGVEIFQIVNITCVYQTHSLVRSSDDDQRVPSTSVENLGSHIPHRFYFISRCP